MLVSALIGALDSITSAEPAVVLRTLNGLLLDRQQGGFATCLVARIAPEGALTLANAGHSLPIATAKKSRSTPTCPSA